MTVCPGCEREFEAEELKRHERDGIVHVHCPECGRALGTYDAHDHGG